MKQHNENPNLRIAQEKLAQEFITDLHGEKEYKSAKQISDALFKNDIKNLSDEQISQAFKGVPTFKLENNKPIIDILTETKIASSRREAREFLNNNAITLNGEIINDKNYIVDNVKKYNIIRKGKKKYFVLER